MLISCAQKWGEREREREREEKRRKEEEEGKGGGGENGFKEPSLIDLVPPWRVINPRASNLNPVRIIEWP